MRGNMGDEWDERECWKRIALARVRAGETAEIVVEVAMARLRALGVDPETGLPLSLAAERPPG